LTGANFYKIASAKGADFAGAVIQDTGTIKLLKDKGAVNVPMVGGGVGGAFGGGVGFKK
jgi:hypothetical protein